MVKSIGEMNRRITFLSRDSSLDESGQQSENFTKISNTPTMWARKEDQRTAGSEEDFTSDQVRAGVESVFTVRHRDDLDESMRLKDKETGDIYNIHAITEDLTGEDSLNIVAVKDYSEA